MKTIDFRPLRRVAKTGKICVAGYMKWRSVKTGCYAPLRLIIDSEYHNIPKDEFVYNSKGELLYFFNYKPSDIPMFHILDSDEIAPIFATTKVRGFLNDEGEPTNYSGQGIDCDGVPTFSHLDADYIATHYKDMTEFEPLTVGMVVDWYGWFLLNLKNVSIYVK